MSDRRAVSAGHLGASSVASANEPWRVAVGGNRVESMTIEQIAYAFHAGQLSERTPLWPPGTSGWQALGNFEQFQLNPAYAAGPSAQLSQFDEAEDDPTRMWTGAAELELGGADYMPAPPQPAPARPSARTGPRPVSRAPQPAQAAPQAARYPATAPRAGMQGKPSRRGNGLMLIAGLVGLVGLGSAVLAARGNWSLIAPTSEASVQSLSAPAAPAAEVPTANDDVAAPEVNAAQLAKYDDSPASAFVAGAEGSEQAPAESAAEPAEGAQNDATEAEPPAEAAPAVATKSSARKSRTQERATSRRQRTAAKTAPRRAAVAPRPKPEPAPEPKAEPKEKQPANVSVNEAAAAALGSSAALASSCRPRGGPSGPGKARVIYSNDGDVESVEILTAKFRDTLTGSCVRMVFRRAKIPAFKGEPPTFIKSFTIPAE